MALISQSLIEARLGRALTADEVNVFNVVNLANQSYLESMIGSSLEVATPATRYYDGGVQHIKIDPCTAITSVAIVDEDQSVIETIDTSDYAKEPINRKLKTMIRYRYGKIYRGVNNIGVTAKFSIFEDTDTLNIVKNALLDSIVSEVDSSDNIVKESIEGYSVEFAKTATKNSLDSVKFIFPEII